MTFQKEKLLVFDKSKLNEIVWTKDVCDFSLGLFLPPLLAQKGIEEFLKTGQKLNGFYQMMYQKAEIIKISYYIIYLYNIPNKKSGLFYSPLFD